MTAVGSEIITVAEEWLAYCVRVGRCETSTNYGGCITDIQKQYSSSGYNQAYCAKFAWDVVQTAAMRLGVPNKLPKTAGAADMVTKAAKVLRVDTIPAPGSVFYHKPTNPKVSSGHIGVIVDVYSNGSVKTIEGNNGSCVGSWLVPVSTMKGPQQWQFIHTEAMAGTISSAGVGGWLAFGLLFAGVTKIARWW